MKHYIFVLFFLCCSLTSVSAEESEDKSSDGSSTGSKEQSSGSGTASTDNQLKALSEQASKFTSQAGTLLDAIKPSTHQEQYKGVVDDAVSAIEKTYNETRDKVNQLSNKLQDPDATTEEIQNLIDEAKSKVSNLKTDVTAAVKNNDYVQELEGKYSAIEETAKNIEGMFEDISSYGLSYNMPIGIEGEFGQVYFQASLKDMKIIRSPKSSNESTSSSEESTNSSEEGAKSSNESTNSSEDNAKSTDESANSSESNAGDMTVATATVKVSLPFLPKQDGDDPNASNALWFEGQVYFKQGGNETNRIYLKNERPYTIPIIKDKANLVFVNKKEDLTSEQKAVLGETCSLPSGEDKGNYVEFDCNGVTAVHLQGFVDFKDYLVAMEQSTEKKKTVQRDENGNKIVNTNDKSTENNNSEKEETNNNTNNSTDGDKKRDDDATYKVWQEKSVKNVYAVFSLDAKGGMVSKLCFSSAFKIKNAKNFVFEVEDAVVDLSTIKNAPDFSLPEGYLPGLQPDTWTGFALKKVNCYFPEEFKLNDGDEETKASAYDLLIDDYGFTGKVKGENIFNKSIGNSGLNVTLDLLTAEFYQNEFIDGRMNGTVTVPFLRKCDNKADLKFAETADKLKDKENEADETNTMKFNYSAHISLGKDEKTGEDKYGYSAKAEIGKSETYQVPFTDLATVTINPGTGLYISNFEKEIENASASSESTTESESEEKTETVGRTLFQLVLSGSLDIASDKQATMAKGSALLGYECDFQGIAFEGFTLQNYGKKVSIKSLALKGKAQAKLLGMTFTLSELKWNNGKLTYNKDVRDYGGLDIDGGIQIIPSGGGNIAPDLAALFKTYSDENFKWHFGGIDLNKIALNADLGAVKLKGEIDVYKDDPTFGKGFKGSVDLTLVPLDITAGVQACFGKSPQSYKYWFTKAACSFPGSGIPVFMNVKLKSLTGGAFYHMCDGGTPITEKDWAAFYDSDVLPPFLFADVSNYKPDDETEFGFIAGMGLTFGSANLATINAELDISFAKHFAVKEIKLGGDFSMIAPTPKFVAKAQEALDLVQKNMKEFADKSEVCSDLAGKYLTPTDPKDENGDDIKGQIKSSSGTIHGWAVMYYKPSEKFFNLNSQVRADFGDLLTGRADVAVRISPQNWYFRLGTDKKPATLKFLSGSAVGKTYFMAGELPSPHLQPLSPDADKKFKNVSYDSNELVDGDGVANGVAFAVNTRADLSFDKFPLIFAGLYLEGGADLLLTNCPKSEDCKWRAKGSIYGDFGIDLGVNLIFKKIDVIEAYSFFGLKGGAPKPLQGSAIASFYVKVGRHIDTYADLHIHMGPKEEFKCF